MIIVIGAAMLIISPDIVGLEGFALMLGGGLGVIVSNRIHKMGLQGEKDRDREMDARVFFERYGVWPDEASPELLARAEEDRRREAAGAVTPDFAADPDAAAPVAGTLDDAGGPGRGEPAAPAESPHRSGSAAGPARRRRP
nr:hypothetical protein [Patulibacter sp. SYSU D01012]